MKSKAQKQTLKVIENMVVASCNSAPEDLQHNWDWDVIKEFDCKGLTGKSLMRNPKIKKTILRMLNEIIEVAKEYEDMKDALRGE